MDQLGRGPANAMTQSRFVEEVMSLDGVAVSVTVVALPLIWLTGLDPQLAVLLSAVLAATDAAAVFSVLRRVPILPRLRIGRWVTIGAGAVVTRDVPDFSVVAGNPARVLRDRRALEQRGQCIEEGRLRQGL